MPSECTIVSFKNYRDLLEKVSPETVVCVRGRHAIGKSEGVYQSAAERRSDFYKNPDNCTKMVDAVSDPTYKAVRFFNKETGELDWTTKWNYEYGIPVIERRLSQMTEGDMIGLPFKTEIEEQNCTQFLACDWVVQACKFPGVLFLDERNRALEAVKQTIFQLADSRAFYGNRIHPETMVIVAENVGDSYQVQQNDPAEISRWVTVELSPSKEEYLEYAKKRFHEVTYDFCSSNPNAIEFTGPNFEPNKKYPDRRSWVKLDAEGRRLGLFDEDEPSPLLRILAGGYVGVEQGAAFYKFCQERDKQIKAEDVLANWKKVRSRLAKKGSVPNEKYVEIVQKLGDWLKGQDDKGNELTEDQARQFAIFMSDCPPEPCLAAWSLLQKDMKNLFKIHRFIEKLMVAVATGDEVEKAREHSRMLASQGLKEDDDAEELVKKLDSLGETTRGRK